MQNLNNLCADYPWLLLPGLLGVTYGGVTLLITNIPLSLLFPRLAGIIVTFISGAFDFSASSQLVVKVNNRYISMNVNM